MSEYYAVKRSPEYLMHYGILGMRWGHRKVKESNFNYIPYRTTKKMKTLLTAMKKMESDFYKNPELVDKHRKAISQKWAKEAAKYFKGGYKEAYKSYYNGYKYGDLDQGDSSSYKHYLQSNPKEKQAYDSITAQLRKENLRVNGHR